jgi:glucokinase
VSSLVADVGATNARFALWDGVELVAERSFLCSAFPTLTEAASSYLASDEARVAARPNTAVLAIATPLRGDRVSMTNHSWSFSAAAVRTALGLERLVLLNDFTALALSLRHLSPDELHQVGGGRANEHASIALLGAGSGLGMSGLVYADGIFHPIMGEGGHATLPATTPREQGVFNQLHQRFGHVSAERVLSGPGLLALYQVLRALDGASPEIQTADAVSERALSGTDAHCVEALELFCGWLGTVAGDLALVLGSHGGVYIGGGIVPRLGAYFDRSPFRRRFEAKGRYQSYLAPIPAYVIKARSPALLGCVRALSDPSPRVEAA